MTAQLGKPAHGCCICNAPLPRPGRLGQPTAAKSGCAAAFPRRQADDPDDQLLGRTAQFAPTRNSTAPRDPPASRYTTRRVRVL